MAAKRAPQSFKPTATLIVGANVYAIISSVRRLLIDCGQPQAAEEFVTRAKDAPNYDAAIAVAREYIDDPSA